MFVDRRSSVRGSGHDVFTGEATYALVRHAQQAVHELWEQRSADICGIEARPDLQLDREEGLGYLLGDVLRGELNIAGRGACHRQALWEARHQEGRARKCQGESEDEAQQGACSRREGRGSRRRQKCTDCVVCIHVLIIGGVEKHRGLWWARPYSLILVPQA